MDFTMVGKLSIPKATEKFNPYESKTFDSGWMNKTLKFNAICGDNRHMLQITGGTWANGKDKNGNPAVVWTFTKGGVDDAGNKVKGKSITIPFSERLTSNKLAEVAEFRKFVIDLDEPYRRQNLKSIIEKLDNGGAVIDAELEKVGCVTEDEVYDAYEESKKLRFEYIHELDFIDKLYEIISSGEFDTKKFRITGSVDHSYSTTNGQFYENYTPKRVYLANDDDEQISQANVEVVYDCDAIMKSEDKVIVSGYVFDFDKNNNFKNSDGKSIAVAMPIAIVIPQGDPKLAKAIENKFTVGANDGFKQLGIVIDMINGSQKMEITDDMLTEEQLDDIECGLITREEIIKDLGGSIYGDRVREYRFAKIGRGYTKGRQDTVFTKEDMNLPIGGNDIDDLWDDEI